MQGGSIEVAPQSHLPSFLKPGGWNLRRVEQKLQTALRSYADTYFPIEGYTVIDRTPYAVVCPVILQAGQRRGDIVSFNLLMLEEHDVTRPTGKRGVEQILFRNCQKANIIVDVEEGSRLANIQLGYGEWQAHGDTREGIHRSMLAIYHRGFPKVTPIERVADQVDALRLFIRGLGVLGSQYDGKSVDAGSFYDPMTRGVFSGVQKFVSQRQGKGST